MTNLRAARLEPLSTHAFDLPTPASSVANPADTPKVTSNSGNPGAVAAQGLAPSAGTTPALLGASRNNTGKVHHPSTVSVGKIDPRLVEATNLLGFKLQAVLDEGRNNVVSGTSVAMLMAMMTAGAKGAELDALVSGLGLSGMSADAVQAGFKALSARLTEGSDGVTYAIANSVWGDTRNFPLDPGFVDRVRKQFGAEATTTELAKAATQINAWVLANTGGMIKDFVDDTLMANCYFAALNAIYFKGTWATEFDPASTFQGRFTTEKGATVLVPMMTGSDMAGFAAQGSDYQAAKLPFGKKRTSSLVVWLPDANSGTTTAQLIARLGTPAGQKAMLADFRPKTGDVYLPKFEVESDSDILAAMVKLGISGAGPFSAAGPTVAAFDVVKQKAKLTINEQGAEAAAVTGGFALESFRLPMLEANRPFVYAILDEGSGAITFSGVYRGE